MMQCDVMWYGVVSLSSYQSLCSSLHSTPVNTSIGYSVSIIRSTMKVHSIQYHTVQCGTTRHSTV
jgi:hypothetical protein